MGFFIRGFHLKTSSDFSNQKFLEHLPYINLVSASDISLENVKMKMKIVVKYNNKHAEDKFYVTMPAF